jgi:hypothetical protein
MTAIPLLRIATPANYNNGQGIEYTTRFNLTGELVKADNRKATECGDCLGYQIKSARATICKGTDIKAHIERDAAIGYIYVTAELIAYIMSKTEYLEFATKFATLTRESTKNAGGEKMRFKSESKALIEWLKARA